MISKFAIVVFISENYFTHFKRYAERDSLKEVVGGEKTLNYQKFSVAPINLLTLKKH